MWEVSRGKINNSRWEFASISQRRQDLSSVWNNEWILKSCDNGCQAEETTLAKVGKMERIVTFLECMCTPYLWQVRKCKGGEIQEKAMQFNMSFGSQTRKL